MFHFFSANLIVTSPCYCKLEYFPHIMVGKTGHKRIQHEIQNMLAM